MKTRLLLLIGFVFCLAQGFAQDTGITKAFKASQTQFMIRGYAHAGFNYKKVGDEVESTFVGSQFSPIFLFKHNDRILFESELEFAFENNQVEIDFEYADLSYIINDFMTIRMGKFLLPFGTFVERLHPAWVNKLSNMPLGFGHAGIAPSSGIGVELRGSFPLGGAKVNYSVYSTNGPVLNIGDDEPEEAGILHFNNFEDNNNNKAFGGRIGLLPFMNSSLEIGASAFGGKVGSRDSDYEDVGAFLYAFDLSFVRQIPSLGGTVDIKAQYNHTSVDDAFYFRMEPGDTIASPYTFKNDSKAYFAQVSYRPSRAGNDILKNFELVGRYSFLETPEGAEWQQNSKQWSVGLNYWLTWRTVFKVSYQRTDTVMEELGPGNTITNALFVHWAIGF